MYSAQTTILRVQKEIKRKGDTQKAVLMECGLSENALKQMTDKQGIASFNLGKIADYLDCSVDYLLGRTDDPQSHKVREISSIQQSNVNSDNNTMSVNTSEVEKDGLMQEFIKEFDILAFSDKVKVMDFVDKLKNK